MVELSKHYLASSRGTQGAVCVPPLHVPTTLKSNRKVPCGVMSPRQRRRKKSIYLLQMYRAQHSLHGDAYARLEGRRTRCRLKAQLDGRSALQLQPPLATVG